MCSNRTIKRLNLSSQANTRSIVLKRSLKIEALKNRFLPRLLAFRGSFPFLVDIEVNASKGYHTSIPYNLARVPWQNSVLN